MPSPTAPPRGFTLIELLVVMAVVALLASLVAPRYFVSLEKGREQALRHTLTTMRDAIDQHVADQGRYPDSVQQLVDRRYLRSAPIDPITGRKDAWVEVPPAADSTVEGRVRDVRSSAPGRATDGTPFNGW